LIGIGLTRPDPPTMKMTLPPEPEIAADLGRSL
jgi:hypothetical protein